MSKRVLLIRLARPSFELTVVPPLGIMYLASALRTWGGHEVAIYDMKLEGKSVEKALKSAISFNPDVVGLSLMSYEAPVMSVIAARLKKALPAVIVVAGGPHPSTFPQDVVSDPHIDICVLGEGEVAMTEILNRLEGGTGLIGIEGTAVQTEGRCIVFQRRSFIEDVDSIPMPAWDLIPVSKYFSLPRMGNIYCYKEYMPIFTSRSCPYQCVYCHRIFGKGFRPRSPESVMEEIRILNRRYGIREIMIIDDCFNLHRKRAHAILSAIASSGMDLCLRFPNGMRADRLDDDMLLALKDAHTFHTCYAIETASPRLQKLIHKNLDIDKLFTVIRRTDELGILTHGFFMIGFPTETREEMLATVNFAVRSRLHTAAMFRVVPYKGTELFNMVMKMGFTLSDDADSFEVYRTQINLSRIPNEEINRIQNSFYRHFYIDPKRLWRLTSLLPHKATVIPRLAMIFCRRAFR